MTDERPFWNPYLAGVALGLVLLASFLVVGQGLGASGGANRLGVAALEVIAPAHLAANEYMSHAADAPVTEHRLVFMLVGMFLGGIVAAFTGRRLRRGIQRGPRIGANARIALGLVGGVIMGMAARLALGCTSGQALSGGALLSLGSWIFMFSVFAGGYGAAWFVRRQWI